MKPVLKTFDSKSERDDYIDGLKKDGKRNIVKRTDQVPQNWKTVYVGGYHPQKPSKP